MLQFDEYKVKLNNLAPALEELAQVGVDCSKITPSFEGALIMITMGTAMSIVPVWTMQ